MFARMVDQHRRATGRGDSGLTLIEIVVAMAVFAILSLSSTLIVYNGVHLTHESSNRVYAASLAATEMDVLRSQDPTTETLGLTKKTITTPRGTFNIWDTAEWNSIGSQVGSCDNGNGGANAYLHLHIEVWGTPLPYDSRVQIDTLLSPQQNSFDPTDGNIAVKVQLASGLPAVGIPVSITNVTGDTSSHPAQNTAEDGCAYFPGLNAGSTWNVSLSQSGYTATNNVATYTSPAPLTVPQGNTTSVGLIYDQAATLSVQLPTGLVTPANMPISIASTYVNTFKPVAAFPYSLTPLFPNASGYQLWLGACNDADPLYPGRTGGTVGSRTAYPSTPGGSATAVLLGVELDFTDVTSGTFTISHAAETGGSNCSTAVSYTISVVKATKLLIPYGTWTFKDASGKQWTKVLDPSDNQINLSMATGAVT